MIVETILRAVRKRPITIDDDAPLIAAARSLSDLDADVVVVHDHDGMLVGVITETDIVRQISHCQGTSCMAAASAVMTKAIVSCRPGDLLRDVWSLMKERCLKNIPVLDQHSRPIGVLNARDALGSALGEVEYEEDLLRENAMRVGCH